MTSEHKYLRDEQFKEVIERVPLFAIDIVLIDDECRVHMGKRVNKPAEPY